jgi:uncharacterized protein (TIGR02453 family)
MTPFTRDLFAFLRELREHNDRDWFAANKPRYEAAVREPALQFISDFGPELERISPHFRADPRPVGGSLYRIHRDIRFSRDKSPYKTSVGIHFRHERGKDAHVPGFYLHLEPGRTFAGVGIWRPERETVVRLRETMAADPDAWRAATGGPFAERFRFQGESLKRPPPGYPPDHPLIEDLKRKDFVGVASFKDADVTRRGFLERYAETCGAASPFMGFLCRAAGVPY